MSKDRFIGTCPCCGYLSIENYWDFCHICEWLYDPTELDPDLVGSANRISLREAQHNFQKFGVIKEPFADKPDPPGPDDIKDPAWRPFDPPAEEPQDFENTDAN
ncbi:CPCC family cysteine-rich protein [Tundrisphaera sp. TA3]|uniref:CPCC family cysteine-rich protein n=1 Tax=Tundrisphaera sp. TA3 TaxID=3435775 RepID=UPI003EBB3646